MLNYDLIAARPTFWHGERPSYSNMMCLVSRPNPTQSATELPSHDPAQPADARDQAVLLVEDDEAIANDTIEAFRRDGLAVTWRSDAESALVEFGCREYRVCMIDRNLPGVDGLTLTKRLREKNPGVALIIISALGGLDDRIIGLQGGADDYIAKPFSLAELIARVRAQLRRPAHPPDRLLRYATLEMDLLERSVCSSGQLVELLPREFSLLLYFMRHPEQLITRDMLLTEVWRYTFLPQTNLVDVHLGRLRRKIDLAGGPSLIQSVRGAGFILRAGDTAAAAERGGE